MKVAVSLALLTAAAATVVPAARACRYCQQAADPVEVMRFQGQGRNAGSFPVDDSLNNLGNGAPAAPPVAAPATAPDPATLVTSATALSARPPVMIFPVAPAPVAFISQPPTAVVSPPRPVASVRWADFGLLGLMGAGGWFAWRTRSARPVAA